MSKLFQNKKIYFFASIFGSDEPDPDLLTKIVSYLQSEGAIVLSEHVARTGDEQDQYLAKNMGLVLMILKMTQPLGTL